MQERFRVVLVRLLPTESGSRAGRARSEARADPRCRSPPGNGHSGGGTVLTERFRRKGGTARAGQGGRGGRGGTPAAFPGRSSPGAAVPPRPGRRPRGQRGSPAQRSAVRRRPRPGRPGTALRARGHPLRPAEVPPRPSACPAAAGAGTSGGAGAPITGVPRGSLPAGARSCARRRGGAADGRSGGRPFPAARHWRGRP